MFLKEYKVNQIFKFMHECMYVNRQTKCVSYDKFYFPDVCANTRGFKKKLRLRPNSAQSVVLLHVQAHKTPNNFIVVEFSRKPVELFSPSSTSRRHVAELK